MSTAEQLVIPDIRIASEVSHGLEVVVVYLAGVRATEHLSLRAALNWIYRKYPTVELIKVKGEQQ